MAYRTHPEGSGGAGDSATLEFVELVTLGGNSQYLGSSAALSRADGIYVCYFDFVNANAGNMEYVFHVNGAATDVTMEAKAYADGAWVDAGSTYVMTATRASAWMSGEMRIHVASGSRPRMNLDAEHDNSNTQIYAFKSSALWNDTATAFSSFRLAGTNANAFASGGTLKIFKVVAA